MLTVDFDRFPLEPGMSVLDVGCGQGRHSYEALRRGGDAGDPVELAARYEIAVLLVTHDDDVAARVGIQRTLDLNAVGP